MSLSVKSFQKKIYSHYKKHGRHSLAWRQKITPYKVLVSELMLQQTQVDRVLPKYKAFLKAFPTIQKLSQASLSSVLQLWSGLGYNRRAKFLHQTAQIIVQKYKGKIPSDPVLLEALPGIGHYTARAMSAQAFNLPYALIETNIRRTYIHFFFKNKDRVHDREIYMIVEKTFDYKNPHKWVWALMDYGSTLAKTVINPNRKSTHYAKQSKFKGSIREVRGAILKNLLNNQSGASLLQLKKAVSADERFQPALDGLLADNLIEKKKGKFQAKK